VYLANDLTHKGVETIDPVAKKAVQDLDVLKTSLQPLVSALDEKKQNYKLGRNKQVNVKPASVVILILSDV
jgi:hypothetical protein